MCIQVPSKRIIAINGNRSRTVASIWVSDTAKFMHLISDAADIQLGHTKALGNKKMLIINGPNYP